MIDLQAFKEVTEETKLFDGSIIHLKKPTQKIIIDMMAFEKNMKNADEQTALKEINKLLLIILNNNTENKLFEVEYIQKYFTFDTMLAFIKAYSDFAKKVQDQNF